MDNGDEYVFQYKNLIAEVPEPATILIIMFGLLCMVVVRGTSTLRRGL